MTAARHEVSVSAGGGTVLRQELKQLGILGSLAGVLMRAVTQRYLAMEAQGLKARSEGLWKLRGPNA